MIEHSPFEAIRQVARQQAAAVAAGDLDEAVRLLETRDTLLASAGATRPGDEDAIRETLHLDRELAGAMREHMLALRQEATRMQYGRTAVSGYGPPGARTPRMLDTER
jgi:hypothetical protein